MEVLTYDRSRVLNGEGIPEEEFILDLLEFIPDVLNPERSIETIFEMGAEELAALIIESWEEEYDLTKILKTGDVRITFETEEYRNSQYSYLPSYYFRDGQLMFVWLNGGSLWVNEEFIGEQIREAQE